MFIVSDVALLAMHRIGKKHAKYNFLAFSMLYFPSLFLNESYEGKKIADCLGQEKKIMFCII